MNLPFFIPAQSTHKPDPHSQPSRNMSSAFELVPKPAQIGQNPHNRS